VDKGQFGNATMNNTLIQTGQISYTVALAERFSAEVPDTINFEFDSAELTDEHGRS
jgi:peptidoglycan-associated lipoprotein